MSDNTPKELRYSEDHEWVRRMDDGLYRLGITEFAQDELGEVVFVELPEVGRTIAAGDGRVDLRHRLDRLDGADLVAGEVVAVNMALEDEPEKVNADVYGDGWLADIRASDEADLEKLMDAEAYEKFSAGG